jgi:hypothetical protein
MSDNKEEPDFQSLLEGVTIEIRNYRDNIKDSRRALHNCAKDERRMYRNVIKYNRKQLREAKNKRRFIEAQASSTWWIWMIAVALCVVLMLVFPGASLALIFSPLWVTLAIGLVVVLFLSKK